MKTILRITCPKGMPLAERYVLAHEVEKLARIFYRNGVEVRFNLPKHMLEWQNHPPPPPPPDLFDDLPVGREIGPDSFRKRVPATA